MTPLSTQDLPRRLIPIYRLVDLCLAQVGDKYIYGSEASFDDPDPESWDCSELPNWAGAQLGVPVPDGSMNQRAWCHGRKKLTVKEAINQRGALLFRDPSYNGVGHVAVSLGNGKTVEARGSAYGVGIFSATQGRVWHDGGLMPGFDYSKIKRPEPKVERAVVFGHYGGRFGHVSAERLRDSADPPYRRLFKLLLEAEYESGAAVFVIRKEPVDLELAEDYPRWRARKLKR